MLKDKGNSSHISNNKKVAQLSEMFIQNNGKIITKEKKN